MPEFDTSDPKWLLVQQIVQSAPFEKSPKLRSFLLFVSERALSGHKGEINEQEIGVQVFGRAPGYNPGDDSIVRSQARILRQKLAEYFAGAGAESKILVEIPKGTYIPVFKANEHLPTSEPAPQVEAPPDNRSSRRIVLAGFSALLVLALAMTSVAVYRSRHNHQRLSPEERFWSSVFAVRRSTVIVPADSTLVLIEEITGSPVSFDQYQSREYLAIPALNDGRSFLRAADLGESRYTSMADLNLVARLMRTSPPRGANVEIRYARDLSVSDAREKNLVLVGGARANPWVQLFAGRMNFTVEFNWQQKRNVIANKAPRQGESSVYLQDPVDSLHRVYGLIAYEQSLDGEGDALLVSGTSSAGTQAAADLLLSNHLFADFLQRVQRPDGSIPHFEVLLSARDLNGNVAGSTILASRVLP